MSCRSKQENNVEEKANGRLDSLTRRYDRVDRHVPRLQALERHEHRDQLIAVLLYDQHGVVRCVFAEQSLHGGVHQSVGSVHL